METLFARALFDNTAESEDELAFRKGDVIMVLDKNVVGSIGWWKCSVHGRKGLAPANRLGLIFPEKAQKSCADLSTERDLLGKQSTKNIYQTPKAARQSPVDPIYEEMNMVYKMSPPRTPSADKHMSQANPEGSGSPCDTSTTHSRTGAELYDVPSLVRRTSMFTSSTLQPYLQRKASLMSTTQIDKKYKTQQSKEYTSAPGMNACKAASLATSVPSIIVESQYANRVMPKPSKPEWIYDVPVFMQKQGAVPGQYGTMPPKTMNSIKPVYDVLPPRVWTESKDTLTQPLYDIPKPSSAVQTCVDTDSSPYDIPPCLRRKETPANSTLPKQHSAPETDSNSGYEILEGFRTGPELHCWRSRNRTLPRPPLRKDYDENKDSQRSSTVSTSSTASSSSRSSCDSFLLSSPEPEPLREVTLSQEEAAQRLLKLQDVVCQSVSKLMSFVSSKWRNRDHLGQHLQQIRAASDKVTDSITCFLNFVLDTRGNAQRLTDSNLQTRLLKQLSIVEDSGLILQQAADALRDTDWQLHALIQDGDHLQTPDHLERFVMVARTVPEDVKRLVSILNANGKLLFKMPVKDLDMEHTGSSQKRISSKSETTVDSGIDDSDYIQLQTKTEKKNGDIFKKQPPSPCSPLQQSKKTLISDHCKLYFGAIQKAINVFLSSLNDGEPPEKFISHSKLVIMVGQRLVNSLCSEAKGRETKQEMLSMSNQLCAQLKQLAIITKKVALNFPDKTAQQEAQDTAKELAQRAQHFRMSLDV